MDKRNNLNRQHHSFQLTINNPKVAYVLEKYAERQGVQTKSTHKMRKTYASILSNNGVPLDSIRERITRTQ